MRLKNLSIIIFLFKSLAYYYWNNSCPHSKSNRYIVAVLVKLSTLKLCLDSLQIHFKSIGEYPLFDNAAIHYIYNILTQLNSIICANELCLQPRQNKLTAPLLFHVKHKKWIFRELLSSFMRIIIVCLLARRWIYLMRICCNNDRVKQYNCLILKWILRE